MKVPLEWLADYVDVDESPEELARILTMLGLEVEESEGSGGGIVFGIKVTANRPDCLCITGVARELAARTGRPLRLPDLTVPEGREAASKVAKVLVEAPDLCPRYAARVVRGVKVGPSPKWMADRLVAAGLRPINNVVDVTNYVLLELGHPLHAFDLARLAGATVVVRRARPGESIETLDGASRKLDAEMLVIADAKRPVAVAGVMGGANTEVSGATVDVLLESAFFAPGSVRTTSGKLELDTEASYRFERTADIIGLADALDRAAALVAELAGGEILAGVLDVHAGLPAPAVVKLRPERCNSLLGVELSAEEQAELLGRLGFEVKKAAGKAGAALSVAVPHHRRDISREADLIEEVARMFGYENIPLEMPSWGGSGGRRSKRHRVIDRAREILVGVGLAEVITDSLLSSDEAGRWLADGASLITLSNPLSSEREALRSSLLPGLLSVVSRNRRVQVEDVFAFETGNCFSQAGGSRRETEFLAAAVSGRRGGGWGAPAVAADIFDAKGALEELARDLGVEGLSFEPAELPWAESGLGAAILLAGRRIGALGEVSAEARGRFEVEDAEVFALEVELGPLIEAARLERPAGRVPRFPAAFRDIAVVVPSSVRYDEVKRAIGESGGPLLERTTLFDLYTGKQVEAGCRSLAFSLAFRSPERTLTDCEVDAAVAAVLRVLSDRFGAKVRS